MKKAIILFYILLLVSKFMLATHLNLFGDEAFYWQCAQRPSLSYIDHPPITAMLVRLGTHLLGDTPLGVRLFFLVCGAVFPFAIFVLARPVTGDKNAWLAVGASLVFPGTAYLGLVAIPDVPMLLLSVLSVACFERATRDDSTKFWVMAGLCGAIGFLTHYRFVLVPAAAFFYLVLTHRGRGHLIKKGPWLSALLLLSGLVPILIFNLQTGFEPVRYYLAGRHASHFSFEKAITFIGEQILMATPFFFIALMGTLAVLLKKAYEKNDRAVFFSIFAAVPLFVFILASPFEDSGLTTVHWPVPGYTFLLLFLPAALIHFVQARPTLFRKLCAVLVPGLSGIVIIVAVLELRFGWMNVEALHRPFSDWSKVAEKVEKEILPHVAKESHAPVIAAADTYVLGATMDFLMHDRLDVYVLDHPKNIQHGRGHQYRIWNRDEHALRTHTGKDVLAIVEETALKTKERWQFQRHLCDLFESVKYLGDMRLKKSGRQFLFLLGDTTLDAADPAGRLPGTTCEPGVISCVDTPEAGRVVSGVVKVQGWAFKDDGGVSSVDIMINKRKVGRATYGVSRPDVQKAFAGSLDPNQPNVGFVFLWDSGEIDPGTVTMSIRVNTARGGHRVLNRRKIIVGPTDNR